MEIQLKCGATDFGRCQEKTEDSFENLKAEQELKKAKDKKRW